MTEQNRKLYFSPLTPGTFIYHRSCPTPLRISNDTSDELLTTRPPKLCGGWTSHYINKII